MLRKWYTGSYTDIAQSKEYAMSVSGFKHVLNEMPAVFDCVRPFCREIRGILFPLLENEELDIGTPSNPKNLYDPILQAFDEAIASVIAEDGQSL